MIQKDTDIFGLRGEIPIDPLLLFRSHLERQQVYSLVFPLRCNQAGDQQLRLGQRVDITQEYDPVIANGGLQKPKRLDRRVEPQKDQEQQDSHA